MFNEEYSGVMYSSEQMQKMPTRQLLKHLRDTYFWDSGDPLYCGWEEYKISIKQKEEYVKSVKAELATREHIPNKQESKAIRKAKIKKGI